MLSVTLPSTSASQLLELAMRLAGPDHDDTRVAAARRHAADLPEVLRCLPGRIRAGQRGAGVAVVRGIPLNGTGDLPTPQSFAAAPCEATMSTVDSAMLLVGALFGVPYSFASQQRGRLVLDVFPVRGHERDQLGCSSTATLEWHNEDAFHPRRAHYSLLACIRNTQLAATRCVSAADLELPDDVVEELCRPQFLILPDDSHTYRYNAATTGVLRDADEAFSQVARMGSEPSRIPVWQRNDGDPLICVDFAYMPAELHSAPAAAALRALREAIEKAAQAVVLAPGDLLVLDNRRCVHGREAFEARFDGTDRWLRRLNVAGDNSIVRRPATV